MYIEVKGVIGGSQVIAFQTLFSWAYNPSLTFWSMIVQEPWAVVRNELENRVLGKTNLFPFKLFAHLGSRSVITLTPKEIKEDSHSIYSLIYSLRLKEAEGDYSVWREQEIIASKKQSNSTHKFYFICCFKIM